MHVIETVPQKLFFLRIKAKRKGHARRARFDETSRQRKVGLNHVWHQNRVSQCVDYCRIIDAFRSFYNLATLAIASLGDVLLVFSVDCERRVLFSRWK